MRELYVCKFRRAHSGVDEASSFPACYAVAAGKVLLTVRKILMPSSSEPISHLLGPFEPEDEFPKICQTVVIIFHFTHNNIPEGLNWQLCRLHTYGYQQTENYNRGFECRLQYDLCPRSSVLYLPMKGKALRRVNSSSVP
jgi:hypothetical protein